MKTTTTRSTAAGPILAIDLGRYKSVACSYDPATRSAAFRTLDTGRADFDRLFARHPDALVVVEACANAGWAHDLARARGLAVQVANTNGAAWRFQHLKRKTDRDDALRLAELEALGQLPTVALPGPAARQRRGLIAHRQALVGRRVAAHLHDPRRFASGKEVSASAGLVPRQYQSGESDRKGRITRRGPGVLRKLLVECAWASLRYNPWARATYARLTRGGVTRKKPAIVALARRLLVRLWAMLRDGLPWRADPRPAAL